MKKSEKWLKKVFLFLFTLIFPGNSKTDQTDNWQSIKRVLVFRLDNKFGNSILILSLVQSIKKSLPDIRVDVMMTASYNMLYQNHPDIDNIIPYDQRYLFRNPFRFITLIFRLRKNRYDVVFSSSNPDSFSVSQAIFARLVARGRTVGFDWKDSRMIYSDAVKGNTAVHYALAQVDLWKYFDRNARYIYPRLYIAETDSTESESKILFWLGATGNKFLDEPLIKSIIKVLENINIKPILAAGPHDKRIIDKYSEEIRTSIQLFDLDIQGVVDYFKKFKIIFMPDTGPMHLVAALNIPLVQIFVNSSTVQYAYSGTDKFIINHVFDSESFINFIKQYI